EDGDFGFEVSCKNVPPHRFHNRPCSQSRSRGNHILLAPSATRPQKVRHKLTPKLLPPRSLRRLRSKKCPTQKSREDRLNYLTRSRNLSVPIERLPKQFLCDPIDHHDPRPGIKGANLAGPCARRNRRQVRDSTNVLHNPPNPRIAKP